MPPPAPRHTHGVPFPPPAGAYDIAEQAACGHDVAALRKGRAEEGLNFPVSWYAELAPLVQHLPQVSWQHRGGDGTATNDNKHCCGC